MDIGKITATSMAATNTSSTCGGPQGTNTTLVTEDPQPLPNLPQEIIEEILLRLPVKSLLRLRCVCRSWRSLVSNPKFAKTHLSLASKNTDCTNYRLLLSDCAGIRSCSLYSGLDGKNNGVVQLDCPLKRPYELVKIWGGCDGLVCIGTESEVCVWNPSTSKYKKIADFETGYNCYTSFGIGYDERIDDYKVVGFFYHERTFGFEPEMKVHALRSDSWRRVEGYADRVPRWASATFVNRALHWLHAPGYVASIASIFSFDLVKETFGEVLKPEYRCSSLRDISLGVLNGCLCVFCEYYDHCYDVWVMKEYGVKDSWTKLVVTYPSRPSDCLYFTSGCVLENGKILLNFATRIVEYDPGTLNYLRVRAYFSKAPISSIPYRFYPLFGGHPYIESLVSPNFDADDVVHLQH